MPDRRKSWFSNVDARIQQGERFVHLIYICLIRAASVMTKISAVHEPCINHPKRAENPMRVDCSFGNGGYHLRFWAPPGSVCFFSGNRTEHSTCRSALTRQQLSPGQLPPSARRPGAHRLAVSPPALVASTAARLLTRLTSRLCALAGTQTAHQRDVDKKKGSSPHRSRRQAESRRGRA